MLKARQKLGKFRVGRRLAEGGFATVWEAYDTIEGVRVALKVPHRRLLTPAAREDFRKEARVNAQLDHPHILPIKNADAVDGTFLIVYPLGRETLHERMRRRIPTRCAMAYAEQMMSALAHAHAHRVIHCDVKPKNFILFPPDRLRLADFGIARFAQRTLDASGSGTLGYMAPEQAMGKPSFRSDVFSLGLIIYEMLTGRLPEWPFEWPPPGFERARRKLHPDMLNFLARAIDIDARRRWPDAEKMLAAFRRLKPRQAALLTRRTRRRKGDTGRRADWRQIRLQEFERYYKNDLTLEAVCSQCKGPVGESMQHCPWCAAHLATYEGSTHFPARCRRCGRGMKRDWRFCAWCFGPGYELETTREYSDKRYTGRCANPDCSRKSLMPYMRYCPWCRTKVRRQWGIPNARHKCPRCHWGVLREFWDHCPWCGKGLRK